MMVQSAGIEPATFWTATRRSNPLSYDCIVDFQLPVSSNQFILVYFINPEIIFAISLTSLNVGSKFISEIYSRSIAIYTNGTISLSELSLLLKNF